MSRILYFDCYAGAAGDMIIGALIDAGLPIDELRRALGSLAIDGYDVAADRVLRAGVSATKFRVIEDDRTGRDPHTPSGRAPAGGEGRRVHAHGHHRHEHEHHDHEHEGHGHRHEHPEDHIAEAAGGPPAPAQGPAGQPHPHRTLAEITRLIKRSALGAEGRDRAVALFRRLAEAEAAVHQMPVDQVHLHEVGELDSIIDIVGAVFAMEWFGASRVVSSPLNVGSGTINSAHGLFPVPAPATVSLLRGVPVYSSGAPTELVTPTGALLVTSYASEYGPLPAMTIERAGYGAGDRDIPSFPNTFRVLVGEETGRPAGDRVVVVECAIDDMNPQLYGTLMERLYEAGALEVYYQPVQMKKNRPGTLVTVIAEPWRRPAVSRVLFLETTTIGLRYQEIARECLERESVIVETPYGAVRVKVSRLGSEIVNARPEFDDCARVASQRGVPVREVLESASRAWSEHAGR